MREIGMSIEPQFWGTCFWGTMEAVAVACDIEDQTSREYTALFFFSLQGVLPCPVCREHYIKYVETYPIENVLDTKISLFKWIHNLQNDVRSRTDKTNVSFEEFLQHVQEKFHIDLENDPTDISIPQ